MLEKHDRFIFANSRNFPDLHIIKNETVPGIFKTETPDSLVIVQIVTLRAKTYAFTHGVGKRMRKLEEITKSALKNSKIIKHIIFSNNELTEEKNM